jgi:Family of unknown function (DUF6523)
MSTNLGFGKPKSTPKVSKRSQERAAASQQYETMKEVGVPEFEIYIRIQDKKAWYPVGAIAVKRSNHIDRAIFANLNQLLQGAFRLYPVLKKHQQQLEYGYRLKEFKDEPIQLAVLPTDKSGNIFQNTVNQLQSRFSSLLKRS